MDFQRNKTQIFIVNICFLLIPVSFILGNTFINLNIIFILLSCFFFFKTQIFKINLSFIDKIVLILFAYISINGVLNNFFNFNFPDSHNQNMILEKSLMFLRFLLLYFVIKFLIYRNIINYKFIFLSFGFCSLFVSIDVLIQFLSGTDLFGYESYGRRLGGPFGEEKVAGAFIQRFFLFLPFFLLLFVKFKNKLYFNLFLFLILIFTLIGSVLSGNRVPFIMLLLMYLTLFVFERSFRKNLALVFSILIIGFIFILMEPTVWRHHYKNFATESTKIIKYLKNKTTTGKIIGVPDYCKNIDLTDDNNPFKKKCSKWLNVHIKEIESGILTWQQNKLFGGGIKSFRWHCNKIDRSKMLYFVSIRGNVNCNNHPHNYYLQIAAELGIVGILLILFLFLSILTKGIKSMRLSNISFQEKKILIAFLTVFALEIFPLKTTGSFFTTANTTFLFIILSFVVGLINKVNFNYKEKIK